ncbi:MAG: outer membrane beta-barrel protein, partial [Bdellovibrionales bacterium]|nr:outer membrane beta-barrel protein [Bdellovibrionales bacterium]
AEFNLRESLLGFRWSLDHSLGAKIALGSLSLLNVPIHFDAAPSDELGIVEAYGEYTAPYGAFRFGLIPLEYGVEGKTREGDLQLPRSLMYSHRVIGLRDYGMRFLTEHKGYYTRMTVHNGEGGENLDGRVWFTASWGWTDHEKVDFGFSGRTGTTKPASTSLSGDTLAGVDPNLEAKWRMGTTYIHWAPHRWTVTLSGTWGEVEQDKKKGKKFLTGYFDLGYDLTPNFGVLGRFDYFDPNDKAKKDGQREISLAWVWRSREGNSRLYFIGTKVEEEGPKVNNDEFRLIWQLTPQSLNKVR